jgi:PAS domain S-box-containing protein
MFRILVVDDEPALLELTRIYLERSGDLRVETTPSPLQALDLLAATPYDAVVADYEMPEMNGITLLKEVRKQGMETPFIIFSGRGREEVVIEAINNGADFYLQKGGNPSAQFAELRNMILQGIRRRQAETEVQQARDLYQSIFEHTGAATTIIESDMTIALANSEFSRLTGYSREEVEGKRPWTIFVAADEIERLTGYHRQRRVNPGSVPGTYEFRLVDRDGRERDMRMTVGSIPGTDRTVTSMIDISDRKRYENELNAAHEEMTIAFEEAMASQESLAMQCRMMEDHQATLQGIIDFLPDPTFVLDREGRVVVWNRAIESVTGIPKSRIIGSGTDTIVEAVVGLSTPLLATAVLSRTAGENVAHEVRIPSPKNGEEACLWAKAAPLYDAQGRLSGAIESLRDITAVKRMEAQIQHRVDLERLVGSISARFIALDPADLEDTLEETIRALGSFLNVDRSYVFRFNGDLTCVENIHEWCAEGIEPRIDTLQNLPADVIAWGMGRVMARKTVCIPDVADLPKEAMEREFLRAYGVRSIILVPIATAGEVLGVIGFETTLQKRIWSDEDIALLEVVGNLFSDLFSRICAQERLRESEERFRTLVERSHDCYIRVAASSRTIEYISPSWERLTGYRPEECTGDPKFIKSLVHPDDREMYLALAQVPAPPADRQVVLRVRRKDGRYAWLEICSIPVHADDGRLIAFEYAVHDINAWKEAEAALLLANRKLSLMNSIVRHDTLNQVTVVLGHIGLLQEMPLDPAVATTLDKQRTAIRMIQSQIEFTRDYQDLGVRSPQWFGIEAQVMVAAKTRRPAGIGITVDAKGLAVYADPLLSTVFTNLLDNTLRHGGTVTAIRVTAEPDGGGARIVWEDNGVGIPREEKERIFERGYGRHTGLGLFLAREVLSITGISIRETGEPGQGARFEILVPEGGARFG